MPRKRVITLEPDGSASLTEDGVTTPLPPTTEDSPTTALEKVAVSATSAAAATNLRIAGASYPEIAATLEYASPGQARAVVEKALAGAYQVEDRETLFRLTAARLDGLIRTIYPKAVDPEDREQIAYGKLLLDVVARQAKLHGLDAPTQVLINPQAEEFNKVVSLLARQAEDDFLEADVFDAEIVEEGEL